MRKQFLFIFCFAIIIGCNNEKSETANEATTPVTTPETKTGPVEFADSKYMDIGKKGLVNLANADVDSWMNSYADNAIYRWNNGDSLVGKKAISDYWKKRFKEAIDSIGFANDIWLAVKVNQPQQPVQTPGTWLLSWYQVQAKYKTGKRMTQWIHTDMHFDNQDKIDIVIQYLDRAVINTAMTK